MSEGGSVVNKLVGIFYLNCVYLVPIIVYIRLFNI